MNHKFMSVMSVSLALLMSVSCLAPYVSTNVYASENVQVTKSSDAIQIEDVKKNTQASVSIDESSENGIVIENADEYFAGDTIPLHVKASNTGKEDVNLRVYFWDYDKTLPKEKSLWSEKLKTACSDVQVSEFKKKDTISVKLKKDKDTKNVDAKLVTEKDKKSKKVTSSYISLTLPAKTSFDTVFHLKSDVAKTVTIVPTMVSGSEKNFEDEVQAVWKEKDIIVESESADDISVDTTDISLEPITDSKSETNTKDIEIEEDSSDIIISESKEEHFLDTQKGVEKLSKSDFTSARLIVLADDKNIIIDTEHLIGSYDNLYLLQYTSVKQAMNAYIYYQSHATAVEPDKTLDAADEETDTKEATLSVTEETNPILSLEEEENSEIAQNTEKVIALLDTGVNESDNVIDRVSLIDDTLVSNGHGDNMLQAIVSQNSDAKILSIRTMGDDGKGTVSSVIAGIEYAINQKVSIINLSMSAKTNLANSVIASEIKKAVDAGIEVVGAAGNDGADVKDYMPGSVDEAWIIGACDTEGIRLEKSNYGSTVDYNVVANSTSEASAKFTGYISKNGSDVIDGDGMIYKGNVSGDVGNVEATIDGKLYLASTLILKVGDDFDPETYLDDLSDYIPEGAEVKLTYSDVNVKKVGSYTTIYDVTVEDAKFTVKRPVYVGKTEDAKPGDYSVSILTDTVDGINANISSVWYDAGDTVEFTLSPVNKDTEIQDVTVYQMLKQGDSNAVFGEEVECKKVKLSKLTDEEKASNVDSKAKKYRFVMPKSDVLVNVTTSDGLMQVADTSGASDELTRFVVNQTTKICCYYNPKVSATGPRATTYRTITYSWKNGDGVMRQNTINCYCVQPSKSAPLVNGNNVFTSTAGNVVGLPDGNVMAKALFYLYNGPMWGVTVDGINMKNIIDTYIPTSGRPSNYKGSYSGSTGNDGYYAMTHLILGYLYNNGPSNEGVWNKADDGQSGDVWNSTGKTFLANVKKKLEALPAPYVALETLNGTVTDGKINSSEFTVGKNTSTWESPWVKYSAPSVNKMKTTLPDGITMHYRYVDSSNQKVEKEATGTITGLPGGTQFYLIIDPTKVTGPFEMTMTGSYPVNFEAWKITKSGNYQDLGFGYYTDNKNMKLTFDFPRKSGLSLQKESANTSITNNNANYSLKDAVYGIYTDSSCTKKTMEIKTNENGYAATADNALTAGTYYVKEITPSKGFAKDGTVYKYTLTAGTKAAQNKNTSKEPVKSGKISLIKKSTIPEMTDNNGCYSLADAEYTVYTDADCKNSTGKIIKTDENGKGSVSDLGFGTYYVKETKASKGFELDETVYTAVCTEGNETVTEVTLNSNEIPGNDPGGIEIMKIWHGEKTDTIPSLEGTQFTIKYYDGFYNSASELPKSATRTWVVEVKYNKNTGKYIALLTDTYIVKNSSDELYRNENGKVVIPYGTLTIQETKAAPGYTLDGFFKDSKGNSVSTNEVYVSQVTKDSDIVKLQGGNEFTAEDTPRYSSIRLKKYASDGKTALAGVEFELKDTDGNLIAKKTTDANGELVFDKLYPNTYVVTETKTASSDYQILAEPITVECPMRITQQEVEDKNMDTTHLVYDENEGVYYAFNQTYEITDDYQFQIPMTGSTGKWKFGFAGMAALAIMTYGYVVYRMMRKRRQL